MDPVSICCIYFIPKDICKQTFRIAFMICLIFTILMVYGIFPSSAPNCIAGVDNVCGKIFCSVSGEWHISWKFPYEMYFYTKYLYLIPVFILPLVYGSWKVALYLLLTGPPIASITTSNPNERPAVWCLFSIALIFVVIKSSLCKLLYVSSWSGYKIS